MIASTGSTHGIRLSSSPPSSASASACARPSASALVAPAAPPSSDRASNLEIHLHGLGSAVAVDEREHAGESRLAGAGPAPAQRHPKAAGAVGLYAGHFELRAAAAIGEEGGLAGREPRAARLVRTGAHVQRALERRAGASPVAGHLCRELDPERGGRERDALRRRVEERAHGRAADRPVKPSFQREAGRNALDLADQQLGAHLGHALARSADAEDRAGREQHAPLVAIGREETLRLAEGGRGGPGDRLEAGAGDVPVEAGCEARLARVAPVEMPARIQVKEHADPEVATRAGVVGEREQARLHPRLAFIQRAFRPGPIRHRQRIRRGRRAQREERCHEQNAEPDAALVRFRHRELHRCSRAARM